MAQALAVVAVVVVAVGPHGRPAERAVRGSAATTSSTTQPAMTAAAASSLFSTLAAGDGASAGDSLAKTLEMLQRLSTEVDSAGSRGKDEPPTAAAAMEGAADDVVARMMEEFERMGKKEDFDKVLEGTMKELLSKDLMYLPMKQICDAFPEWLARNRASLPREDYEK